MASSIAPSSGRDERDERRRSSPTSVASPPLPGRSPEGDGDGDTAAPAASGASKEVTPPPPSRPRRPPPRRVVGANGAVHLERAERKSHPEMEVHKDLVEEILLIGSVVGTEDATTDPANPAFVPSAEALNWLRDLQRVLYRDHDVYRPISALLGKWNFARKKLIPICLSCGYNKSLVLTACKILVILTKPMSAEAKRAGRLVIDAKSGKVDDSVVEELIKLRKNAIDQSERLMEYKAMFVRHASHRYVFENDATGRTQAGAKKGVKKGGGLFSVFVDLLHAPLAKTGSSRESSDHQTIELVLTLISNLLSIAPLNTFGSPEKVQKASQLHRDLLVVLKEENVLDVLTVLGQEVERRENAGYNLLLMEILGHLLRGQDPTEVALSAIETSTPTLSAPVTLSNLKKKSSKTPTKTCIVRTTTTTRATSAGNSLKEHLQSERNKLQTLNSSRHSYFGGTLLVSKQGGKQSYVSATNYLSRSLQGSKGAAAVKGAPARRKNKKAEVFAGSGKASSLHSRPGASSSLSREVAGPAARRAKEALHGFCAKFVQDCYGPLMKSLKNEFRRESARLEDGDKAAFFRIIWFFHQWWRVGKERRREDATTGKGKVGTVDADGSGEGKKEMQRITASSTTDCVTQNLIFTMDVFMFNLVLNSTDEYFEHKKPAALAQTVALYTEMIHMLHAMYESKDSTERTMALGLMDRLFYMTEPLDRLPRLLSRWTPSTYSREYLCDLVECTHVTWKLLDANARRCQKWVPENEAERKRPKDAVERMALTALEFDIDHYFSRKFVSNQIVFMYTQLLSQYAVNAAHINRHIAAYFIRLCKFSVKKNGEDGGDDLDFDDALGKNHLVTKLSTAEPILYNIGLFMVLDKVLNDPVIRDKKDFNALLMFASSFMKRFAHAAEANPMLYVEALFKHPNPQRFCEMATNNYVTEELRMIAMKDLLLEDQRKYEQEGGEDFDMEEDKNQEEDGVVENKAPGYEDDEEEELEFNDDDDDMSTGGMVRKKSRRKSRKSRKTKWKSVVFEDQSDNEDEEAEINRNPHNGDNANTKDDEDHASTDEGHNQDTSPNAIGSNLDKQQVDVNSPPDAGTEATDAKNDSPKLSGKRRIRKSQEARHGEEESDEEDFFSSSFAGPPAKVTRRVIFEDDD